MARKSKTRAETSVVPASAEPAPSCAELEPTVDIEPVTEDETALAVELFDLRRQMKLLETREEEIKAKFKTILGPDETRRFGDFQVSSTTRARETLSRAALERAFGVNTIRKYCHMSPYVQLTVRHEPLLLAPPAAEGGDTPASEESAS